MTHIVLLHGYPLDESAFAGVADLVDPSHTVHAVDLAGFGAAPWPSDGDLSMSAQADHVFRQMDGLGVDAAVVVGLSMGGYVALAMAERQPDRVRALGLVGSKPDADSDEGKAGRDNQAETVVEQGAGVLVAPMSAALLSEDASLSVRARLRTMIERTRAETYVSALEGMRDRPDRGDVVASFDGPIGILVGTSDPIVSPDRAHEVAASAQDAFVVVLDGVGHLVPMEAPAATAEFINDLAQRV